MVSLCQAARKKKEKAEISFDDFCAWAGLDEGLLSLSLYILVYMENPYRYKKCQ